jgi:hypothetical protein
MKDKHSEVQVDSYFNGDPFACVMNPKQTEAIAKVFPNFYGYSLKVGSDWLYPQQILKKEAESIIHRWLQDAPVVVVSHKFYLG